MTAIPAAALRPGDTINLEAAAGVVETVSSVAEGVVVELAGVRYVGPLVILAARGAVTGELRQLALAPDEIVGVSRPEMLEATGAADVVIARQLAAYFAADAEADA